MVSAPAPPRAPADLPGYAPVSQTAPGPAGPREQSSPRGRDTAWGLVLPRGRSSPRLREPVCVWRLVPPRAPRSAAVLDAVLDAVPAAERELAPLLKKRGC